MDLMSVRSHVHIGIPLETRTGETRVAATPETVKKYVAQGHQVIVQAGAGIRTSQADAVSSILFI
ncbi:hypothetical protein CNECB9_3430061 [Cupriavidus necator]|uniref:Alanine dehydrogenase/pyridine nucleotide transhydrogenase N-terminal domain-containing protein n=1 Tax=Cupriavidus necator TaxID=106590 RepID=A0A1K0IHD7_CUPNE|nr:hypothetical protein CNECB9_3430061 [Cupriavidus necator]